MHFLSALVIYRQWRRQLYISLQYIKKILWTKMEPHTTLTAEFDQYI